MTDPATGRSSENPSTKQQMWSDGLTRTLGRLHDAGHPVLLVGVIPHPRGEGVTFGPRWDPRDCAMITLIRSIGDCGISVSLAAEDARQARSLAAEHTAVERTGISYLDLRTRLCPEGTCATNDGNAWIYRDGHHLTNREALALEPPLQDAITGVG